VSGSGDTTVEYLVLPERLFKPDAEGAPVGDVPPPVNGMVLDSLSEKRAFDPAKPDAKATVEPSTLMFTNLSADAYKDNPLLTDDEVRVLAARIESLDEGHMALVRAKLVEMVISAPTAKKGIEFALRLISGAVGLFP
jgi:hypothetical protein